MLGERRRRGHRVRFSRATAVVRLPVANRRLSGGCGLRSEHCPLEGYLPGKGVQGGAHQRGLSTVRGRWRSSVVTTRLHWPATMDVMSYSTGPTRDIIIEKE
jgi:hypothetical protein